MVNNVLRWSLGELKLSFRINLSQHMYNQYLKWVISLSVAIHFAIKQETNKKWIFNENTNLFFQISRGFTFYKMSNLDNRISNADQLLTNDIDKFCESVTDFYSNASKPMLDIIIYMYKTTSNLGAKVSCFFLQFSWSSSFCSAYSCAIFWCFFFFMFVWSKDSVNSSAVSVYVGRSINTFTKTNG